MGIRIVDLTPELKEKLAKFMPIPLSNEFEYIPKVFREMPTDKRPVFKLKHLDGIEMSRSMDSLWKGNADDVHFTRGEYIVFVCERGIIGWDGYFDIKYENRGSIKQLPPELLSELCDVISKKEEIEAEEKQGLK